MKTGYLLIMALIMGLMGCNDSYVSTLRETPVVTLVKENAPAVVNISTEALVDLKEMPEWGEYGKELDAFLQEYYGEDYSEGTIKYNSIGSGVILNKEGLIVTNAHVIEKAKTIFVVLRDGSSIEAQVVVVNRDDDLAIIKAKLPHSVKEIKLAEPKDIMIGETVVAIGNALGFEDSVTVGVISGKDRSFSSTRCKYVCSELLQTDASINPGNSGGALFNLDGELVGINLAVVQNAQNIGFAIPAYKITRVLEKLRKSE